MRMLAARRQRGITGCLVHPRLQLRDLRQQNTNDRLRLRRLPSNQLFRDQRLLRHALGVTEFADSEKINSDARIRSSCERLLIDASSFANPLGGGHFDFLTSNNSSNLILEFTPVPEPSTLLLGTLAIGSIAWKLRRHKRPH
ncbi:MAG TPA: PEP-CTERM sorting domain-containing protein [Pirellulales bacterium]|nr:PEP-CTERM sorting domain-containing protein [Pirellulales bacterium]